MDALSHGDKNSCLELEKLVAVVQQLSLARDLNRITEIVRHEAKDFTGADGASFVLRDADFCYYVDEEAISPLWKGARFPMDQCVSGWVMQHRETVQIEDIYADPRVPHDAYRPTFVKSMLMVPIRTANPIGAIGNYWAKKYRPTDMEVRLLQALADTTAVAMENVQVYAELERRVKERTVALECEIVERKRAEETVRQQAISDSLTGLLNRRGFFLQAEQELKIARRSGRPALLIFADLDGLKKINDAYGHGVGDRMIANAAAVLRQVFRKSDILARFGGDEFVAFTLDAHDPARIQERIRVVVDKFNAQRSCPHRLSFSIGLSGCDPCTSSPLEQLVEQADIAMYREKQGKYAVDRKSELPIP